VPLAEFGIFEALGLLGVGALAGMLGGLLGIGGGIVMIPAMAIFLGDRYGIDSFHAYKQAAISTSLVLSLTAVYRHRRAQAIVYRMLPGIIPLAMVGVIGGVLLASTMVGQYTAMLRRTFGGFLEVVVLISLYQEWQAQRGVTHLFDSCPMPNRRSLIGTVVGVPAGVIAGLLGVGGGIWAVPAQRLLFGVQIRNAIANSACMILFVSAATALGLSLHNARLGGDPPLHLTGWWLTLWLAPGAFAGGWVGATLTHVLPVRWLRYAFLALLTVTGMRLILT
jgi:uncharacterized membrane protein YfcA